MTIYEEWKKRHDVRLAELDNINTSAEFTAWAVKHYTAPKHHWADYDRGPEDDFYFRYGKENPSIAARALRKARALAPKKTLKNHVSLFIFALWSPFYRLYWNTFKKPKK